MPNFRGLGLNDILRQKSARGVFGKNLFYILERFKLEISSLKWRWEIYFGIPPTVEQPIHGQYFTTKLV